MALNYNPSNPGQSSKNEDKPRKNKGRVQAITFENKYWTIPQVNQWIYDRGYKPLKAIHTTENWHRVRLIEPSQFSNFSTEVDDKHHIHFIIGYND